jgi:hypothetical protein
MDRVMMQNFNILRKTAYFRSMTGLYLFFSALSMSSRYRRVSRS